MALWSEFVDLLQAGIFTMALVFGGNVGAGIVSFSLLVRLAMLPLTLHLARKSLQHRAAIERLRPELERLRKRFRQQPRRLAEETARLFEQRKVRPVDSGGLLGGLGQMPLMIGLFTAVRRIARGRFLWIADIARPDILLAAGVSALTAALVMLQPNLPEQGRGWLLTLPVVISLVSLSKMAAGVGLYWGASSAVGLVQVGILRRWSQQGAPKSKSRAN